MMGCSFPLHTLLIHRYLGLSHSISQRSDDGIRASPGVPEILEAEPGLDHSYHLLQCSPGTAPPTHPSHPTTTTPPILRMAPPSPALPHLSLTFVSPHPREYLSCCLFQMRNNQSHTGPMSFSTSQAYITKFSNSRKRSYKLLFFQKES